MTRFRSTWTTVDGLELHDRADETGSGMPIVLLHGLAVSHRYLLPTARHLAPRHPVIVPDMPGFGRSAKPRSAYDVSAHAAVLADWLVARGLGAVCLLGHSFGAEVAARIAVQRPEAVAALVLASPTSDPAARSRSGLIGRWSTDLLVEQPWQAPILLRDIVDAKPWRVLATVGHSVHNAIEEDLCRLPVRPLVLGGALDPVAPMRWRAEVAALSGGTEVTVPGAAHNVLTTSGRRSAAAIMTYLASGVASPALRAS